MNDKLRKAQEDLLMGAGANRFQYAVGLMGQGILLLITSLSAFAVLFIFIYIIRDAIPFFQMAGKAKEFFTVTRWYPSGSPAEFGALAIFVGSGLVTAGAIFVATPLGIFAALCLSDVLPFSVRQIVKPIIEMLAAIPSVAYGFFALVILAPLLQDNGGKMISVCLWLAGAPIAIIFTIVTSDLLTTKIPETLTILKKINLRQSLRFLLFLAIATTLGHYMIKLTGVFNEITISSGTNALNASIILGIMALPTIVSVAEDSLSAIGRELREGSYALGATRAETLVKVVIPAASSGILAAVLLGVMRAVGETMVVWMAAGNANQIPEPWYNLLSPVRTLTATIAGEMGEADHVTGSGRYHVLFAMALCLLIFSFVCNLISEWAVRRSMKKLQG